MMMKTKIWASVVLSFMACGGIAQGQYHNPVIDESLPDPTVIRADDGSFWLYATENIHNLPIYRSTNLVDWSFQGTAFTDSTRPDFVPDGGIWAPDINQINGKYVLYYCLHGVGNGHVASELLQPMLLKGLSRIMECFSGATKLG